MENPRFHLRHVAVRSGPNSRRPIQGRGSERPHRLRRRCRNRRTGAPPQADCHLRPIRFRSDHPKRWTRVPPPPRPCRRLRPNRCRSRLHRSRDGRSRRTDAPAQRRWPAAHQGRRGPDPHPPQRTGSPLPEARRGRPSAAVPRRALRSPPGRRSRWSRTRAPRRRDRGRTARHPSSREDCRRSPEPCRKRSHSGPGGIGMSRPSRHLSQCVPFLASETPLRLCGLRAGSVRGGIEARLWRQVWIGKQGGFWPRGL